MSAAIARASSRCRSSLRLSRCLRPGRESVKSSPQWLRAISTVQRCDVVSADVKRTVSKQAYHVRNLASHVAPPSANTTGRPVAKGSTICTSSKMVLLEWNDGTVSRYPFVWLRDNCRCTSCYHHEAQGRIALIENLDVDLEPTDVALSDGGARVTVHWPDDHQSPFETGLLKEVTFKDEVQKKNTRMWGSELGDDMPTFQYYDIMTSDTALLNFLEELRDVGIAKTLDVPMETGHVAQLANRISHMKLTSYGYTHTVKSKVDTNSLAYTGHKLGLHTDLPHYHYTPNINLFHCIQQSGGTTGGESVFVDGFKTALQLKEEDPEAFEILCNTHCDFIEKGVDMIEYYTKGSWPIFSFDRHGNLAKVHYSNALRDPRLRMPAEKVYPYYKSIKKYDDLIHREENTVVYRMQPGDLIAFDNTRILHARKEFQVTRDAVRHLETTYLDWDGAYSKIRCLREKLGMPFHEY